ncbi:MAG: HlyC/CorC family transporter [Gemmatimonadaceae bacterium]|nr:HlyC/CorC family transporter [Gemmatimonadaceae bacterium]
MTEADHLTWQGVLLRITAVLALVTMNGFFVAAEFAAVGARRSKLQEMVDGGDRFARLGLKLLDNLDRYISATQLGITIASLALGWVGEPVVAALIDVLLGMFGIRPSPGATHTAAGIAVGFAVITFLHVVYGELAPKTVALVMPERLSGLVALPLIFFAKLMTPFIALLNGTANASLRLFGIKPISESRHVHSPEELRMLVMQARAHGTLDESDSAMLAGVFDFHEKKVQDVMRPRTEMAALPIDATEDQVRATLERERYSRYPVYQESLDDVVGVFLAKDLWLHDRNEPFSLKAVMRDPLYVPATRPAVRVLDDLRKTRAHMAVVLDEYGGTAGIVTMEDLIEEVIGDIADEYDMVARESVEVNGVLELAGNLSLIDVRSDHRVAIPEGDWATLGGYVFARLGRIPRVGDRVAYPGGDLEVIAMDGRRVAGVRVNRRSPG